jgi:hypothetical protein
MIMMMMIMMNKVNKNRDMQTVRLADRHAEGKKRSFLFFHYNAVLHPFIQHSPIRA